MNPEVYKFYISKIKMLKSFVIFVIMLCLCVFAINESTKSVEVFCGYAGIVLFGIGSIVSLVCLFNKKPFLTITPDYVKIKNYADISWRDVGSVIEYGQQIGKTKMEMLRFYVINEKKYPLSFMQKLNKKLGGYPFDVSLNLFPEKEKQQIRQIICKIKNIDKL